MELGLPADELLVIYVGAHGIANGLGQLLDAALLLVGEPVSFVLIGTGMEKQALQEKAAKLKLTNVLFYDPAPKEQVFKYILSCDIGTSALMKSNTFKTVYSNKTFDYMSCRKPVLLAIDGVSRTLVEEADCGLFVEPENAEQYAERVRWYLSNRDAMSRHGLNGYQYAKKHFDRRKLAIDFLAALENID